MYGLLDLSIVTDQLLDQLRKAKNDSRLWDEEPTAPIGTPIDPVVPIGDRTPQIEFEIVFTGQPPDAARQLSGACKVSLYLFHIAPDKFWRNTYPQDRTIDPRDTAKVRAEGRPREIPQQPLALTLYYLLSAHSESYIEEQQAMSIALKSFHDHPIVVATVPSVPLPNPPPARGPRKHEFTVTMEPETIDEIGRLWQSMNSALRLSAVYRANVIFMEPEAAVKPTPKPVKEPKVTVYPHFSGALARESGRVTVWGGDFLDVALEVRFNNTVLTRMPGPPRPPEPQTAPPAVGRYQVFNNATFEFQLPSGTTKGFYRLAMKVPEQVEMVIDLRVPEDIP